MKRLAFFGSLFLLLASSTATQESPRSLSLDTALREGRPGQAQLVWVFFRDKGDRPEARLEEARRLATPRALSRRRLRGQVTTAAALQDLPIVPAYIEAVAQQVSRLRNASRWFNAVSVEATPAQIAALEALPFVSRLDVVRRYRRPVEEPVEPLLKTASDDARAGRSGRGIAIDYGTSLGQLSQIGVPAVHDLGLRGEGVVVAIFDTGFDNLAHEVFSSMSIVAAHDFVNGDSDVADGADRGSGSHGTNTLSVLGGFKQGQLVGPAFEAHFILAKTEDTFSETPVEEDNWAAAAEWAEALGADVISSSLGYLAFDTGHTSYTYRDMDGETAISTRAADLAAARGVVVVNSAGNAGFNPERNTLGAPADGKRVIAAGAVTAAGVRSSFSSVGPSADGRTKPDLAAQGSSVKVASSSSVSGYGRASGTSFSCPLTAGVAALVLQAHPTYTVDQVIAVLRSTASQAAQPDNFLGWGIVDAIEAVSAPEPPR